MMESVALLRHMLRFTWHIFTMKSLSSIRSKIYISEKVSSAKRPRLASDTQEMPGSQKQIFVNSTDFGDKYLGKC